MKLLSGFLFACALLATFSAPDALLAQDNAPAAGGVCEGKTKSIPCINQPYEGKSKISGTAADKAKVVATVDKTVLPAVTANDEAFEIKLGFALNRTSVTVEQTDAKGGKASVAASVLSSDDPVEAKTEEKAIAGSRIFEAASSPSAWKFT